MKIERLNNCRNCPECGAALVVTLIVCVVLAMVVVALMQTTTLDRSTAQAIANNYRAQLAADSAIAEAKAVIATRTRSDDYVVLQAEAQVGGSTVPIFYIGEPATKAISYYPLFSGGATQAGLAIDKMPDPTQAFSGTAAQVGSAIEVLPHLSGGGSVPVGAAWVDVKDANNKVVARYAYWAEDLGGYLDADLAGAKPHKREAGNDPAELGLFSLVRPAEQVDSAPDGGLDAKLISNRKNAGQSILYSVKTLGLPPFGLGDGLSADGKTYNEAADFQQFFASNLRYSDEPQLIPRGFDYKDAGQKKLNINTSIAKGGDTAVQEIATKIKDNLPKFDDRKGGFPTSQDYVQTLAANIVDYADIDSDATLASKYRGVDSYPFVTQIFLQVWWVNNTGGANIPWYRDPSGVPASAQTWKGRVKARYHIQVWNPSNKEAKGKLRLDLAPIDGAPGENFVLFFDGNGLVPLHPLPGGVQLEQDLTLQPNEYRAISFPEMEYVVDTGLAGTTTQPPYSSSGTRGPRLGNKGLSVLEDSKAHGYAIYWNGKLVDRPGPIQHGNLVDVFERNISGNLNRWPATSGEGPEWRGGLPGLRHATVTDVFPTSQGGPLLGDPRGSYYVNAFIAAQNYAQNASWWGRHWISPNSTSGAKDWFVAEARLRAWPDGAHQDDADRALALGDVPPVGSDNTTARRAKRSVTPEASTDMVEITTALGAAKPPLEVDKAPSRISNAGSITNLTELGNIYDPIQWSPKWEAGTETIATVEEKWKLLGSGDPKFSAMVSDSKYVVPSSLRVGRGEFQQFDVVGQRASQLLDLFAVDDNMKSTRGLININTASEEVLRTLGAGITITSDARLKPAGTLGGPYESKQGDLLAEAIIANRPYVSASQLSSIKTAGGGTETFFGNPEVWEDGAPTAWNDSAAEEYFRKLFGLTAVRSRNFRIFVVGQALASDGTVLATSKKECQIFSAPERDASGNITSVKPVVVSEKSL